MLLGREGAGEWQNQIFEIVESKGYSVGCISPMNTLNKLKEPKYFIPDPWTVTKTDKTFWSRNISKAINQAVNDNSNKKIKVMIQKLIGYTRWETCLLSLMGVPFQRKM